MRVSLAIIAEYLRKKYSSTRLIRGNQEDISGVRLWNPADPSQNKDYLFICYPSDISSILDKDMNFIIIGDDNEYFSETNRITITKAESIHEIMGDASEAIEELGKWHRNLLQSIVDDNDIQALLNMSSEVIKNPLLVFDPWRVTIASKNYSTNKSASNSLRTEDNKIYVNFDVFNKLYGEDHLKYLDTLTSPKYFKNEKMECPYIISNLVKDSKRFGLLIIVEQNKVIDELDMLLCKDLTEALNMVLSRIINSDYICDYAKDVFFIDALKGKPLGMGSTEYNLKQLGWNKNDNFIVFVILGKEDDNSFSSIIPFLSYSLANRISDIKVVNIRNSIAAIVNLRKSTFCIKENLDLFISNINQRNLALGLSKVFNNFFDIHNYYQQASYTAEQNKAIHGSSVHYEDYLITHLMDTFLKSYDISFFMHPAIDKLARQDHMHKNDLILTLYTYLINNKSYNSCVEKLHVHKSTVVYRLKLIKDIAEVDYDDEITKINLLVSMKMYLKKPDLD
jgi:hypothetical protein